MNGVGAYPIYASTRINGSPPSQSKKEAKYLVSPFPYD